MLFKLNLKEKLQLVDPSNHRYIAVWWSNNGSFEEIFENVVDTHAPKKWEVYVTGDTEIGNVLNKHFINSVRCLAEKGGCSAHFLEISSKEDPLDNIITCFQYHLSLIVIGHHRADERFNFSLFTTDVVSSEISNQVA